MTVFISFGLRQKREDDLGSLGLNIVCVCVCTNTGFKLSSEAEINIGVGPKSDGVVIAFFFSSLNCTQFLLQF